MQNWSSRKDGDCLLSSGENKWLQTRSNRLFVRPCYPALFQECQTLFGGSIQGVFLVGTPGIGKSAFLDYALHRFLSMGKSVLYLHGPYGRAFVFRSDGAAIEEQDLTTVLKSTMPEHIDLVLYDPHENAVQTQSVNAYYLGDKKFIVALSPDEENCKKLRKDTQAQATVYMGTLSLEEAEAMRSTCYSYVTTDLLQTRNAIIGGIARHLFRQLLPNHSDDEATTIIEDNQLAALNDIAQNPLRIDRGEVASDFKHLWSLYHLKPCITESGGINYYKYTIELCCDDVRIRIRDMLMKKDVQDLWDAYTNTNERHGTLRRIRYEAYAHKKILVDGINGTATSLTTTGQGSSSKHVTIPAALPRVTLSSNDLGAPFQNAVNRACQLPTGGYLLPESSNFPVVDSLFASSAATFLLQMKAGRSKPLFGSAANGIHAAAGGDLVFVVPDESIIRKKLAYSEADGPSRLRHYRLILKESW